MTTTTAPMSKLDAVNQMLASIGQAPVSQLDVVGLRDVNIAALSLDTITRSVLLKGWAFNTDYEWPIAPDSNDNILIPNTALVVDPTYDSNDYVMRDNGGTLMMWDRYKKTFTITEEVKCDVTWGFEFEAIPQAARDYIYVRAARIFQSQVIGSPVLFEFTELHEREALATLQMIDNGNRDANILTSNTEVNNTIFKRRRNSTRY